jgi:succinate dehydrogenase flavin-adding protein (antitoxin of CptAB toxin-antitoxin module)
MDTKVYGFVKDNENQLSDDSKASVSSIMELQSLEKSLHSQLNQEVAANRADATEQQKLVDRINELTSMRN